MKRRLALLGLICIAGILTKSLARSENMTQIEIDTAVETLFAADDEYTAALTFTNAMREAENNFSLMVATPNKARPIPANAYGETENAVAIIRVGAAIYLWQPRDKNALSPFFFE